MWFNRKFLKSRNFNNLIRNERVGEVKRNIDI